MKKKDGRANNGGKRVGAGNVLIYGEKTKVISICIPETKEEEIREKIKLIMESYKTPKNEL